MPCCRNSEVDENQGSCFFHKLNLKNIGSKHRNPHLLFRKLRHHNIHYQICYIFHLISNKSSLLYHSQNLVSTMLYTKRENNERYDDAEKTISWFRWMNREWHSKLPVLSVVAVVVEVVVSLVVISVVVVVVWTILGRENYKNSALFELNWIQ